jgi:hypothetical protein
MDLASGGLLGRFPPLFLICHPATKNDSSAKRVGDLRWNGAMILYDDGRGSGVGRALGVGIALGVFKRNVQFKSTTGPQPKAPAGI